LEADKVTVDPSVREQQEQMVVDKIINEGNRASDARNLEKSTDTGNRVQDLEEERAVPLRPHPEYRARVANLDHPVVSRQDLVRTPTVSQWLQTG
jgi:hypothetical protein